MASRATSADFELRLPEDFDDYWEVEDKGWFSGAVLVFAGKSYRLNFFDPVRLGQEVSDEIDRCESFLEDNLVVIRSLTRARIEAAAKWIIETERVNLLVPMSPKS